MLEKVSAGRTSGVSADLVKGARYTRPKDENKPTSEMTNPEKAWYYLQLARKAPTAADTSMWQAMAIKFANADDEET
jgi:hypothetical protein